jgi:hypothetical protein
VVKNAIPEIQDMVTSGEISVNTAKDISTLPEDDQREFVALRNRQPRIASFNGAGILWDVYGHTLISDHHQSLTDNPLKPL